MMSVSALDLLLLLLLHLQEYLLCGFDFVVAPLVQPGHEQPALQLPEDGGVAPRLRSELMLSSASWGGQVCAAAGQLP